LASRYERIVRPKVLRPSKPDRLLGGMLKEWSWLRIFVHSDILSLAFHILDI
jgi:hypothetical protein